MCERTSYNEGRSEAGPIVQAAGSMTSNISRVPSRAGRADPSARDLGRCPRTTLAVSVAVGSPGSPALAQDKAL